MHLSDYKFAIATNRLDEIRALDNSPQNTEDSDSNNWLSFSIDKLIIISEESSFTICWKLFDLINCIISSYAYAWLGAFGDKASGVVMTDVSIIFESCFAVSMFLRFITDYRPEGE